MDDKNVAVKINEEKIIRAKELIKMLKNNGAQRGIWNSVLNLLKDDIAGLKNLGVGNKVIVRLLNKKLELNNEITLSNFTRWLSQNFTKIETVKPKNEKNIKKNGKDEKENLQNLMEIAENPFKKIN